MKKVKVMVQNKNTLVLEEDAVKGDFIDLTSLNTLDFSNIEKIIEEGKDQIYNKKVDEIRNSLKVLHQKDLQELQAKITLLSQQHQSELQTKEYELTSKFNQEKRQLDLNLELLKQKSITDTELLKTNLHLEYQKQIEELKHKVRELQQNQDLVLENLKNEQEVKIKELTLENQEKLNAQKEQFSKELSEKNQQLKLKEEAYNLLQRQKAVLNIKQTGEDLEAWCDNEVKSYMQNGLFNCVWKKDNIVVKEDGEIKGSKADYLFMIYANETHLPEELLASICLDMKDENPDSVNKKKNSDYYSALDKNRIKKNCKYAVLVSNLETDKANDVPILKVTEYSDMYVVRPAYLMTFLNMVTSLTKRFADLILADEQEKIELMNSKELLDKFNELKYSYLDKPIMAIKDNIEKIKKNNDVIIKASKAIEDSCYDIIHKQMEAIEEKLNRFEIKITSAYKKFDKKERQTISIK
ncbi:MAG: DUF2130 domain-containing protein [Anaeroplasmataceae bacterium]|nr:DUF2130 domain-containing protein [Anaeroplasmataceae bacterium]